MLCLTLIAATLLVAISSHVAIASLCQAVTVSSTYPHQESPGGQVQVSTTVSGSCTSDGEDYFSVRVDLSDGTTKALLSANSAKIGYSANNFSVTIQNAAVAPSTNQTWPVEIDTYLIQAGGTSGQSLLNTTTVMIQVGGDTPLPEFQISAPLLFLAVIGVASVILFRRKSLCF
jgi:hypothetical protein